MRRTYDENEYAHTDSHNGGHYLDFLERSRIKAYFNMLVELIVDTLKTSLYCF